MFSATWDMGEDGRDNGGRGACAADVTVSLKVGGGGVAMHVEGVVVSWSKVGVRFVCCGRCLRLNSGGRDAGAADTIVVVVVKAVATGAEVAMVASSPVAVPFVCPGGCLRLDSGGRGAGADAVTVLVEVWAAAIEEEVVVVLLSGVALRCVCPGRCLSLDSKMVASKLSEGDGSTIGLPSASRGAAPVTMG
jgi:hypothetical protein